jgi:hypothetical protein
MMIPDDSFNFNHFGAHTDFDAQEVRLRRLLQQDAMPVLEASRHLLLVCPVCKCPWYKAGSQDHPRLTPEQLVLLGAALQVDIQALYLLPRAFCPICSTLHLGGIFSATAYPHHSGYRFLWESISPRRIQLLAMVCRGEELTLDALLQMAPDTVAEPTCEIRSMLAWLESCPCPEAIQAFTDEQRQHLALHCPPGRAVDGSQCLWRGYAWETSCPPLGGDALVSLAVAIPMPTLPPFDSLRLGWRVLARAMRVVL